METILGLIFMLILLMGGCCLFFLVFVQPIWGIVDVAVSKEHSGGTKAVVILLTLLLLGPIMTFFYACFGTRSRILRSTTLICFAVLLLSGGAVLGLAIAVPMVKQKLPWLTEVAEQTETGTVRTNLQELRPGDASFHAARHQRTTPPAVGWPGM